MVPIKAKGKFEQPRVPVQTAQAAAPETPKATITADPVSSRKAPKAAKSIGLWIKRIAVVIALVLAAAAIALYVYGIELQSQNTVFPNVHLAGISVGGMTATEALNALTEAANTTETAAPLDVELPDQTLVFSPETSRTFDDPDGAAIRALNYGKDVNPFKAILLYRSDEPVDLAVPTTVNLDTDHIRSVIDRAAAQVNAQMEPSSIAYNEEQQLLVISTGSPSVMLDADSLYDAVCQAYTNGNTDPIHWDYVQQLPEPIDLASYYNSLSADPTDAWYDAENRVIVADIPGMALHDASWNLLGEG